MEKTAIIELVIESINRTLFEENGDSVPMLTKDQVGQPLLGKNGLLDSHGLVAAIILIEEILNEKIGRSLTIADERAFMRAKSPFRSVGSLAEYIDHLLREQRVNE